MKKSLLLSILIAVACSQLSVAQDFNIQIDAEKDAWYENLTGPENGLVFMPARCYLRDIGDGPDGDDDLSAKVWMSWNDEYLYTYAEVKDDAVLATSGSRWLNDCIELKFDPDPTFFAEDATANMRLTALGEGAAIDNINGSSKLIDAGGTPYVVSEDDYARKLTADGYVLEFRVPRAYINTTDGRSLEYNPDGVFGLAINIGDNDDVTRDNMLQWSAGHSDAAHSNPYLLGSATFLDNHVLGLEAVSPIDESIVNDSAAVWYTDPTTGIEQKAFNESFELLTNYPNPFNPRTKIQFQLNQSELVTLTIHNARGELIQTLISDQYHSAGSYEILWNGMDQHGIPVSSGVYVYQLSTPASTLSEKMLLLK